MARTGARESGPTLSVDDPYATPALAEGIAAVYLSLRNDGAADRLVAASTDAGGGVTISASDSADGAMETMVERSDLDLPASETVSLEPGGTHLMVGPVSRGLIEGDEIELSLEFATSEPLTVRIPVVSFLSISDRIATNR